MNWSSLHHISESLATSAHEALTRGDSAAAKVLFSDAADAEERAFESVSADKPRTLGITAVSAAALWYKAGDLERAERLAHAAAAAKALPAFAKEQLRELLQSIWNEQAGKSAGGSFAPGQVIVSMKGGDVVSAPGMRKQISDSLHPPVSQSSTGSSEGPITLNGTLRALDLDNDWLEVLADGENTRVRGVGEAIDDIIGPMVNRKVKVSVRNGRRGELILIDIEQQE